MPLQKAGCRYWNGSVYAYGLKVQDKKTQFLIFRFNQKIEKTDSLAIDLGKTNAGDYLMINSDSLHDYLNIYVQKKEKKLVNILRFDKKFRLIANIENVDVARLNSIAAFESEICYFKNSVYTVKVSSPDSGGRQFYLNKYTLKSELKNFEYDFVWQFPFEKKNINSAHIVLVSKSFVMVYVNVIEGSKAGQWLLRIDPVKGTLIRGTKLNKGDAGFYTFGAIYCDSITKQVFVTGQKFLETELSQKDNKVNNAGKPYVAIYLTEIDSMSELISRQEFKIPVNEPKGNKIVSAYILRTENFQKTKDGNFLFEHDIYKGVHPCYQYCNTISHTIALTDEKLSLDKNAASTNTLIEKYYFSSDKADVNGKLCADSLMDFEKLYYKSIPFKVRVGYKLDETNNGLWLLKKSDAKKGIEDFSILLTIKKVNQLNKIIEIPKAENAGIFILSKNRYVLSRQLNEENFEITILNW